MIAEPRSGSHAIDSPRRAHERHAQSMLSATRAPLRPRALSARAPDGGFSRAPTSAKFLKLSPRRTERERRGTHRRRQQRHAFIAASCCH